MNARRATSTPPLHFSSRLVSAPSIYGLSLRYGIQMRLIFIRFASSARLLPDWINFPRHGWRVVSAQRVCACRKLFELKNIQGCMFFIVLRCLAKNSPRRAQSTPAGVFCTRLVFAPSIYGLISVVSFYSLRILDSPLAGLGI